MTFKVTRHQSGTFEGLWVAENLSGDVLAISPTNAGVWRKMDKIQNEPVSACEVAKDFKEPITAPTESEMQDFMSGLVYIGKDRGYSDGWAWHRFQEKFGHTPEGLHRIPMKPNKSVWGWLNRKAIAKAKS